jgi:hypothetical protein
MRREKRRVGRQGDGRQPRPREIRREPAGELGRQALAVGRAPAIAAQQQLAAFLKESRKIFSEFGSP